MLNKQFLWVTSWKGFGFGIWYNGGFNMWTFCLGPLTIHMTRVEVSQDVNRVPFWNPRSGFIGGCITGAIIGLISVAMTLIIKLYFYL